MNNKDKQCNNCIYFVQHYAKVDKEFLEVYCGHCINLANKENIGVKNKTDVCSNYKAKHKDG